MSQHTETTARPFDTKQEHVLRVGFAAPRRRQAAQYNPLERGSAKVGDSSYDRFGGGNANTVATSATPVAPGRSPLAKSSTQIPEDTFAYSSSSLNAVEPPYNLEYLTLLNEISVTRQACITALATNTVGLGFQIVKLQAAIEDDVLQTVGGKIRRKLNQWAMKDGKSFTQLLYAVMYDQATTGNGYVEVERDRLGRVVGLYHVPAYTMRRRKDKKGWIQERPGAVASMWNQKETPGYVEFYNFGDKYDPDTGALRPNRDAGRNEIIWLYEHSARTSFYGLPCDIACLSTYAGDEMARNHNVKYLTNAAVPELALVFEVDATAMERIFGDQPVRIEIPEDVKLQIEEHFRYNLSSPHYQPGIFHLPMGVRLRIERLSQPNKDAGWAQYRNANKAETLRAWRTPAVIIGDAEAAQYATATVQKHIYQEQVIGPKQLVLSEVLMNYLWPELHGIENASADGAGVDPEWYALRFLKMSVADKAVDATVHNVYLTTGVLDQNEVREEIGYARRPERPAPPAVPIGSTGTPLGNVAGTQPMGGRGANGAVTPVAPRRPGDSTVSTPDNAGTTGRPYSELAVGKRADLGTRQAVIKADIDEAVVSEYMSQVESKFEEAIADWQREAQISASERVLEGAPADG